MQCTYPWDSATVTYMLEQLKHNITEWKCNINSNILLWMKQLLFTLFYCICQNFLLQCTYSVNCNLFSLSFFSQFNAQSSSITPQLGLGAGVQASGINSVTTSASLQPQPSAIHQPANQQTIISSTPKDAGSQ